MATLFDRMNAAEQRYERGLSREERAEYYDRDVGTLLEAVRLAGATTADARRRADEYAAMVQQLSAQVVELSQRVLVAEGRVHAPPAVPVAPGPSRGRN